MCEIINFGDYFLSALKSYLNELVERINQNDIIAFDNHPVSFKIIDQLYFSNKKYQLLLIQLILSNTYLNIRILILYYRMVLLIVLFISLQEQMLLILIQNIKLIITFYVFLIFMKKIYIKI